MENAPLNKAHQLSRLAEKQLKQNKFEKAIELHKKIIDLINETIKTISNKKSIESLELQKEFHIKQQNIIQMRKELFTQNNKKIDQLKKKKLSNMSHLPFNICDDSNKLQTAIYKKMEEADSLLWILKKKNLESDDNESTSSSLGDRPLPVDVIDVSWGKKKPKDDDTVIEELRTVNTQLRTLIVTLVKQLEISTKETEKLKEKIKQLEEKLNKQKHNEEFNHLTNIPKSSNDFTPNSHISPFTELSSELEIKHEELPILAPLDLPNFDFSRLTLPNNKNS